VDYSFYSSLEGRGKNSCTFSTEPGSMVDSRAFSHKKNVHFYPLGISNQKSAEFITLIEAFQLIQIEIPENSVFVKMDIERFEFRVLPDLLNFEQIY
jgi:hypothetical protein